MIVVAVMALVAACGGNDETDSGSDIGRPASVVDADQISVAVDAIEAEWGAADGFAVTIIAVDNGYTVAQIVESPLIDAVGMIEGVEPDGEPAGLIEVESAGSDEQSLGAGIELVGLRREAFPAEPPTAIYIAFIDATIGDVYDAGQAQLAQLKAQEELDEQFDDDVAFAALALLDRGYSLEQIIESMVFGTIDLGPLPWCLEISDQVPVRDDGMPDCPPLKKNADPASNQPATDTAEPPGDVGGQPGTGGGSEQGQVTEGRYVGSLDDAGSILDVEVGGNSMEVVVEGGSVTEFSLEVSGRYSACFGGYGVEDEVSCTVWLTWDAALSDGPVAISEGSADVPVTSTMGYTDCESELASECKDWDYTEVDAATARISFTAETMTGSFLFEGQDSGTSFTATRL